MLIEKLTLNGDGLASDGNTYPRVLPGEEIMIGEDGNPRIVTSSPDRIKAPCAHFKMCGGCSVQHASDTLVADWKMSVIETGLAARGLSTEIRPILTSPAHSRRRAVMHGRRTKKGATIGFYARRSELLVDAPDCVLLDPALLAVMPALKELTILAASRKSEVSFTLNLSDAGDVDVALTTAQSLEPRDIPRLASLAHAHKLARLSWNEEPLVTLVPPRQQFGTAFVTPPPGAFLQATHAGEAALVDAVIQAVGAATQVADLFAGCGTFSLQAAQTAQVSAWEGEDSLTQTLELGWRAAEDLHQVTAHTRDLFRRPVLASELKSFDAIIIDPPRAGAEAQTKEIAGSGVKRVACVSCNPVTFARDAKILTDAGYSIDWLQPIDQFRWSAHVELVAQFTKESTKP
ncbi:MAG: class I SAM-dependent RNA methyltransferase [Pseudomonadota bacterium]